MKNPNPTKFTYQEGYDHVENDVIMTGIMSYGLEYAIVKAKEGLKALLEDENPTEHTQGCINALKEFIKRHAPKRSNTKS